MKSSSVETGTVAKGISLVRYIPFHCYRWGARTSIDALMTSLYFVTSRPNVLDDGEW